METEVFLDTHALLWLFAGDIERIGKKSQKLIDDPASSLLISPISVLEIDYLYEIGKVTVRGQKVATNLAKEMEILTASDSLESIIHEASKISWTRDVFDRILVAHSKLRKTQLITKDRTIQEHYSHCVW